MNEHGYLCYTYYLYHVPTGKKYYGSRIANRCEPEQDLWHKYFSSSELVEALIKEYGKDSFVAEVRKTFDNIKETRDWEYYVLRRLKAPEKDEWLNQTYSRGEFYNKNPTSTSFKSGKDHIYFGKFGPDNHGYHKTGKNNPNFGNHDPMPSRQKPVRTPLGVFSSVGEAAKAHSCGSSLIVYRCKHKETYSYISKQSYEEEKVNFKSSNVPEKQNISFGKSLPKHIVKLRCKPVRTPLGIFESIKLAALAHGFDAHTIAKRCNRKDMGYEYLPKN